MQQSVEALIVDNDKVELYKIHQRLGEIKFPATPYLYDFADPAPTKLPPGVRFCFLDIHILDGVGADNISNFSAMHEFLSSLLAKNNGPYVAIAWTKDTKVFEEFKSFLLDKKRMGSCPIPIDVVCVDKQQTEKAINKIEDVLLENIEFQALLDWEKTVKQSAAKTINSLFSVSSETGTEVNDILKGLGHSSIGHSNLKGNEFMGVNEALLPILKDHQTHANGTSVWSTLFPTPSVRVTQDTISKIAPMLNAHLLYEHKSKINKKTPGAIVDVDYEKLREIYSEIPPSCRAFVYNIACCKKTTDGRPDRQESKKFIKGSLNDTSLKVTWHLLELSPCCDFAQNKVPRSKYLIGLKIIAETQILEDFQTLGNSPFMTPITSLQGDNGLLSRFVFCSNHVLTMNPINLDAFNCKYRVREQLFVMIQNHYANHVTRSGLIVL